MNLCESIIQQSSWAWNQLKQAKSVKFQLQEETLTDMVVLDLKRRHPREIFTRTFKKAEESLNGADWECWLTGRSGKWLGCRVQAKVLNLGTNRFEHLHYKPKPTALKPVRDFQSDTLINVSQAAGRIPLYCLYSHGPAKDYRPSAYIECYASRRHVSRFGCSLVFAPNVRTLRGGGTSVNSLSDLLPYMFPWHSFFCCRPASGPQGEDLPHRAYQYWRDAMTVEVLAEGYAEALNVKLLDSPPGYVNSIFEGLNFDQLLGRLTVFNEAGVG